MDDSMYPVDAVRPLARALCAARRSPGTMPIIGWSRSSPRTYDHAGLHCDAAEDQRERTLREHARMIAAFMNHDGAAKQTTLGEILERDRVWRG
jgi:hypothetical protein